MPAFIALLAAGVGWSTVNVGPLATLGFLGGVVFLLLTLRNVWVPYIALLAVATLLPFLVLPVSMAGAKPTLFEIVAGGALASYFVIFLIDRRERLIVREEVAIWLVFGAYLAFAFVLGSRFGAGSDLMRLFARFGLAFALFWLTLQLVRSRDLALRVVEMIVVGVSGAAAIGLLLYAGGAGFTERVLVRLVPYGYPDSRIVRYIEDNPSNPMRAVGTGVDPNAFGGMLMLGFVLAVGLLLMRGRRYPTAFPAAAAAIIGLAILLTFLPGGMGWRDDRGSDHRLVQGPLSRAVRRRWRIGAPRRWCGRDVRWPA
ncbi:MAG: hypothetical protein R2849_08215 [Thermomicrobiales bacterium]